MDYLDKTESKIYFSKFPTCQRFIDCIDDFIPVVDSIMDQWIGSRLGKDEYCETRQSNHKGTIVLWNSPVIELLSLEVVDITLVQGTKFNVINQLDPYSVWDGDLTLHTGNCDCSRFNYIIKYIAGVDPIPPMVTTIARMILQELLENGSSKSLFQTPKELLEASNPGVGGNFKQRFQRGTTSGTLLDQLMMPLKKYKKHIHFG